VALLHFGIFTAKGFPVYCVEGVFVPVESFLIVSDEKWKPGFCTDSHLEVSGDSDTIDGETIT
jgi:hypothetical protein